MPAVDQSSVPSCPPLIASAGQAAWFAWEEFFYGKLRNEHTRRAYRRAVEQFLGWCERRGLELHGIAPRDVGWYLDQHTGSPSTKKQQLAALRHFFDGLVLRHAIMLNPAASVRGERYQVIEGKTPEITVEQARTLLASVDTAHVVGLRDRAIIAVLIYTAARIGAVSRLRMRDFYDAGDQHCLRFLDKGGKSREIPVRHDLRTFLFEYMDAADLQGAAAASPLFRSTIRRTRQLTENAMTAGDMGRMIKRRMRDAGLPARLSPTLSG